MLKLRDIQDLWRGYHTPRTPEAIKFAENYRRGLGQVDYKELEELINEYNENK